MAQPKIYTSLIQTRVTPLIRAKMQELSVKENITCSQLVRKLIEKEFERSK